MRLLFKQRLFSWLDSYDIYDEAGRTVFTVKGVLSWGHCLEIYDGTGRKLGCVKEEVLTFLPRFHLYAGDTFLGTIRKEFSLFHPSYNISFNGWRVEGDLFGWEYAVYDSGEQVARVFKELLNFTDTYVIDVPRAENVLYVLMTVLAIDAANCSKN